MDFRDILGTVLLWSYAQAGVLLTKKINGKMNKWLDYKKKKSRKDVK